MDGAEFRPHTDGVNLTLSRACRGWLPALLLLASLGLSGAQDNKDVVVEDTWHFLNDLLNKAPRFHARGVMTSNYADKPTVKANVALAFDKDRGAWFAWDTAGKAKKFPYDWFFCDGQLQETVYDETRSKEIKKSMVGMPVRPLFNFVWGVLQEVEKGPGMNTFLFKGLMKVDHEKTDDGYKVIFSRRLAPIAVEKTTFRFDRAYRLKLIEVIESNGNRHKIEIRRYYPATQPLSPAAVEGYLP